MTIGTPKTNALLPYVAIFIVAAVSRLIVAYLFFGSVDIVNDTLDSARLVHGTVFSARVPYLPGVHLFLWLGGQLAARSHLPVAFCYKIFPCLFDSLIAVLIALSPVDRPRSLCLGYFYALAPVPVIVMALQGQWDGVFLYFLILSNFLLRLGTRVGDLLAGAAFVLSVVAKPVAAPLIPFLFPAPWLVFGRRGERNAQMRTLILILAMGTTTLAYLLLLVAMHSPLGIAEVREIVAYTQHGVQLMGLPMLHDFGLPRTIGLLSFVALLPAYWRGRLSRERAILLFFAFVLGICGSAPQYLSWIVPFAMLSGDLVFAALYNFLSGIVLLLFYRNPGTGGRNIENLGTYSPLRALAWLAPPLTDLHQRSLIVFYGGNLIIPLIAIAFFTVTLLRIARRAEPVVAPLPPATPRLRRAAVSSLLLVALLLVGFCLWAKLQPPISGDELTQHIRARIDAEYWCIRLKELNPITLAPIWGLPSFVDHTASARPVNAFSIGVAWTMIWTAAAFAGAIRMGKATSC
ncbi:MAG TPA: hypothetical protein VLC46_03040 [Thermoanaerobaculia bacterium]|nr:hypothetical protein [Thermoanaerobaculia bacterium]